MTDIHSSNHALSEPLTTIVVTERESYSSSRVSLDSIFALTSPPFHLVYVNGAAPRTTTRWLTAEANRRGFDLVSVDHHLSPNEARNLGASRAGTRYVAFVDNDVVVAPGWLDALVSCAEETGAWLVAPIYCIGEPVHQQIHAADGVIQLSGEPGQRRFRDEQLHSGELTGPALAGLTRRSTGMVEFHVLLVRREALDTIGQLDEGLRSTPEHHDLCLSVREAGGSVWFEPRSVVTYLNRTPMLPDLSLFVLRWSRSWNDASIRRFRDRWGLAEDDPWLTDHQRFLDHHRRRYYHALWLWRPRGLLRRLAGARGVRWFDAGADYLIADPLARRAERRRARAGLPTPAAVEGASVRRQYQST